MLKDAYYLGMNALARFEQRRQLGTSIFDSDAWDICVVLDSCRYDMLEDAWSGDVNAVWSVGSVTTEWLANTFHAQRCDVDHVGFVSATPHSTTVFRHKQYLTTPRDGRLEFPTPSVQRLQDFAGFHELWKTHAGDRGAVPPDVMLDATLQAADRHDRVVSHWLQPHEPFIAPNADYRGGSATEKNVWKALQNGEVSKQRVWPAYTRNLEYALNYVRKLLESYDGTVLVTSDHGNAFGSFGVYGHPFGWPEPAVRRVPWLEVSAERTSDYQPADVLDASPSDSDRDEQLRALGYK